MDDTNVVYFGTPRQTRKQFYFKYGNYIVKNCGHYTYLGSVLHQHLDFNVKSDILAGTGEGH